MSAETGVFCFPSKWQLWILEVEVNTVRVHFELYCCILKCLLVFFSHSSIFQPFSASSMDKTFSVLMLEKRMKLMPALIALL